MKNLVVILIGLVLLSSCTKSVEKEIFSNSQAVNQSSVKQTCNFGISQFNLAKHPFTYDGKRPTGGGSGGGGSIPPPANASVILLDFDGQLVSGTSWNYAGDIICAPANLSADAINLIINRVTNDYSPFNVVVTTDEAVFNATSANRIRLIFTESWEWFGQAGGTAMLNTFTVGSITPCFVFSSLLNYNIKNISEAAAHEVGHTIGLNHQSIYDAAGVKTSEYNYGQGTGEIAWAPIMGCGYNRNLSLWHKGPSSLSSTSIQDDVAVITAVLGNKADDYSNTISGAASLPSSLNGVINNPADLDFFSINIGAPATVTLTPFNVGVNHEGADVDMVLRIYNSQGGLISTTNNGSTLNAVTLLAPGTYFISAGCTSNPYATTYGMIGKYNISFN